MHNLLCFSLFFFSSFLVIYFALTFFFFVDLQLEFENGNWSINNANYGDRVLGLRSARVREGAEHGRVG